MRLPALLRVLSGRPPPLRIGSGVAGIAGWLAASPAIPGAVVGWTAAEAHALGCAGTRRQGADAPVRKGDLWHVGSLTKSFTATLAARMVASGEIGWETTAGEALGRAHPGMEAHWRDVRLEEFLRHASGLRANAGVLDALRVGHGPRFNYVSRVLAGRPAGPRGGFIYSNAGYVVAAAMLEAAAGASWERCVAREIFTPLGLASAGLGPPEGDQPQGHRLALAGGLRPVPPGARADNAPALGPAGRVHLSGEDMLRYLRAHLDGPEDYLPAEGWARLHAAQGPGRYAMGWAERDGVLRHSGSNGLWFAQMRLCRESGVALFVAANSAVPVRTRPAVEAAADAVLGIARRGG